MKKFYKIILLLTAFIFLSTFNPKEFNLAKKKSDTLFKIENIEIKNNFLINKSEIEEKLSTIRKENIFFIKREDIEKPLKEIDFLHKIEVKKRYPSTVIIKIFETKPVAILFKNKVKYIIDSSSNLISFKKDMDLNNLPGIFGERAEKNFMNFFYLLDHKNFKSYNIIDLRIDGKIIVK